MPVRRALVFVLVAACGSARDGDTAARDGDTDTDTDDTIRNDETGAVSGYVVGEITTADGAFTGGRLGLAYLGASGRNEGDWICQIMGDVVREGDAPAGCPGCEWSFDLSAVTDTVATGAACAELRLSADTVDGRFDYAWGFAPAYSYDYNGAPLLLEDVVFVYIDAWQPVAFDYGGRDWTSGDATDVTFARPDGYSYFYYY